MTAYKGRWALVTGASAGLGKGFATLLARRGANLVLVARREDRLQELATSLSEEFAVQTKVIVADLAQRDAPEAIFDSVKNDGLAIDILINNAGFGLTGEYSERPWSEHKDFIELMITSYAALTRLFLDGMVARKYGRIIQVSSVAGLVPGGQGHTQYGAAKAYLVSFAQSLAAENERNGVHVTALCPGFTMTEFHDANGTRNLVSKLPSFMMMPADPVIEGALNAVEKKHVVYVPGTVNKAIVTLSRLLPRPWAAALMRQNSKKIRRSAD